ncbi:MAG: chromate transporter [Janthinobacterium lividum]
MSETAGSAPAGTGGPGHPSLWELARTFNTISLASFGGGLSAWSREIVVMRRGWMNETEFLSAMTICRLLPGANQVNVAIFVGARMQGMGGAAAAVAGLIAIPFVIIVALCAFATRYQHVGAVQHVLAGLNPAAVALTLSMVWQTGRKTLRSMVPFALCLATTVAAAVLRVPLWATMLVLGPVGVFWSYRQPAQVHPGASG